MSITDKLDILEWSNTGKRLPRELFVLIRNHILDDYDDIKAKSWVFDNIVPSFFQGEFNQPPEQSFVFYDPYPPRERKSIINQVKYFQDKLEKTPNNPIIIKIIQLWFDIIEVDVNPNIVNEAKLMLNYTD